jgi:hypothetical protein
MLIHREYLQKKSRCSYRIKRRACQLKKLFFGPLRGPKNEGIRRIPDVEAGGKKDAVYSERSIGLIAVQSAIRAG